jgi:streptogramin lyase
MPRWILLGIILISLFFLTCSPAFASYDDQPPVYVGQIYNPRPGSIPASFYNAKIVAVDHSDDIYVGDRYDFVQKFSPGSAGSFLLSFGGEGTTNGKFETVGGIVADSGNNIYISDTNNNRVQKFDANGNYLMQWGSMGSADGKFHQPTTITCDSTDNIYVFDSLNYRVEKFDSNGTFLTKWGSSGTGDGKFGSASGMAVDSSNNIYVLDSSNHRVQEFTSTGDFLAKWGSFLYPASIVIDSSNYVYVSDLDDSIQKFNTSGVLQTKWGTSGNNGADGTFRFLFLYSAGLARDSANRIYTSDYLGNRVQVFDTSGNFLWQVGSEGTGNGQMNAAVGMTVDSQGNIYVVEGYGHRVQKFDASGNFLAKWGSYGSADGQLEYPMDIAEDSQGNFYVDDQGNARITKYDSSGNFLAKWGSYGSADGQFNNPVSMFIDSSDNIYVADSNNHRIQKFDTSGNFKTEWTSDGQAANDFDATDGIYVDKDGNMYVTDYDCHVHKFTASGQFLARWGSCGDGDGQFDEPTDVTVDSYGYVYVADNKNNRIQKFTGDGKFLTKWGGFGYGPGKFYQSGRIKITSDDKIYVADSANNRIQIFQLDVTAPADSWTDSGGSTKKFDLVTDNDNLFTTNSLPTFTFIKAGSDALSGLDKYQVWISSKDLSEKVYIDNINPTQPGPSNSTEDTTREDDNKKIIYTGDTISVTPKRDTDKLSNGAYHYWIRVLDKTGNYTDSSKKILRINVRDAIFNNNIFFPLTISQIGGLKINLSTLNVQNKLTYNLYSAKPSFMGIVPSFSQVNLTIFDQNRKLIYTDKVTAGNNSRYQFILKNNLPLGNYWVDLSAYNTSSDYVELPEFKLNIR